MHEYFLESRGIYYRTNEMKHDRESLVFVHGLSGSASAWFPYEKHFERKYNVVTFDLRGHGKSRRPRKYSAYALPEFVGDLSALVNHLAMRDFVLVSHSLGAIITLEYIRMHPHNVKAAVLVSPSSSVRKTGLHFIMRPLSEVMRYLNIWPIWKKYGTHVDYKKYDKTGDWNLRRMFVDIKNTGLRVYLYCLKQISRFSRERFVKDIRLPTLVIHGTEDTIFSYESAKCMAGKIPGAKFVTIEGGNHVLVIDNVSDVTREVEEFLRLLPSSHAVS